MWLSPLCAFCRGAGRREGEPDRDRANRKTETPASPQRALPLPAVRESTRDTHQVPYKDTHTHEHHQVPAVPMDGHLSSHEKTNAHFLSFTWCLFLPSLPIRGKCSVALLNETEAVLSYLDKEVSQRGKQLGYVIFYRCLPAADCVFAGQVRLFQMADDKNWGKDCFHCWSVSWLFFSFILWSA